ncbi:hypothetical protein [Vibrio phage R01]|nr:hypothetical protein [Vibrio phage R01]
MTTPLVYAPTVHTLVNTCRRIGITPSRPALISQPENLKGFAFDKGGDPFIIFVAGQTVPLWLHQFAVMNNVVLLELTEPVFNYYERLKFRFSKPM